MIVKIYKRGQVFWVWWTWSKAHKRPKTVLNDFARLKLFVNWSKVEFVQDITRR